MPKFRLRNALNNFNTSKEFKTMPKVPVSKIVITTIFREGICKKYTIAYKIEGIIIDLWKPKAINEKNP